MSDPCSYHNDYIFSMSGAHRKPAYPLGTPSLTWHRGFWKDYAEETSSIQEWIESIEELVCAVQAALINHRSLHKNAWPAPQLSNLMHTRSVSGATDEVVVLRNAWSQQTWKRRTQDDGSEEPNTRYEAVQISGTWQSFPLMIRFEVFEEYFSITCSLDFSLYESRLRLIRPQGSNQDLSLSRRISGREFFASDALACVDALFPILLASEGHENDAAPGGSIEYTFCTFGRRRAIYASGFGPQFPNELEGGNPLTYLVLVAHDERRQIGRMMNRLHTLGCVRLASMVGFRQVLVCDEQMPGIVKSLNDVNVDIERANFGRLGFFQLLAQVTQRGTSIPSRRQLENVLHRVDERLRDMDATIRGISQRSRRLEYYSDRFRDLAIAMRIGRITGYQPYDEFVQHRIDRVYKRILGFSARHANLWALTDALRAEIRARANEEHQQDIRTMQRVAEVFFLLVLLPVYAGELVEKANFRILRYIPDWIVNLVVPAQTKGPTPVEVSARVLFILSCMLLAYRYRVEPLHWMVKLLSSIKNFAIATKTRFDRSRRMLTQIRSE